MGDFGDGSDRGDLSVLDVRVGVEIVCDFPAAGHPESVGRSLGCNKRWLEDAIAELVGLMYGEVASMAGTKQPNPSVLWTLLGIAIAAMIAIASVLLGLDTRPMHWTAVVGVSAFILVWALPVCVVLLLERARTKKAPEVRWSDLLHFKDDEREYQCKLDTREDLTAEEFYRRYYEGTGVPEDIVLRLLPIYCEHVQVPAAKLRPDDWPPQLAELDCVDMVRAIEQEFRIAVSDSQWQDMRQTERGEAGSFDSLARYLAQRVTQTKVECRASKESPSTNGE